MAYRKQIFTIILEALILAANTAYGFHHIDLSSYIDIHLRGYNVLKRWEMGRLV